MHFWGHCRVQLEQMGHLCTGFVAQSSQPWDHWYDWTHSRVLLVSLILVLLYAHEKVHTGYSVSIFRQRWQREIKTWWDGWSLGLVSARQSSTCQLRLDMPLRALTKPRTQKRAVSALGLWDLWADLPKFRKQLRYGMYTPEIQICYCNMTIYSGLNNSGDSEHSQCPWSGLTALVLTWGPWTDAKRENVGAFYTWKLERLQVHHGIGKLVTRMEYLLSNVHFQSMSLLNFMAGELECTLFKEFYVFLGGLVVPS